MGRATLAVRVRDLGECILVVAAVILAVTALAAALITTRVTFRQRYWQAGYYRLLAADTAARFDGWLPVAAAAAVAIASAATALPRTRPGRRSTRAALVSLAVVAILRSTVWIDAYRVSRGPNLLLISIDTLRADHLGAYGYPLPTSPAIDRRLAGEGVVVEEVYSQSPKTTPSHMTMLTSLFPCVHGIELWWGSQPAYVLNPAVHTLAEVLRNAGYATAAFTGGAHMDASRGFDQGFEVYESGQGIAHPFHWMKHHRRRKFFVFFHTYQVHDPYVHPLRYIRQFDPDYEGPVLDAVNRLRGDQSAWEDRHHIFWASVDRRIFPPPFPRCSSPIRP